MLTTRYCQFSVMNTASNEVVNRVAIKREEDTQSVYHVAKCDYQLTMDRVSPRLSPTQRQTPMIESDGLSTYSSVSRSSQRISLGGLCVKRGVVPDDLDCREIDEALSVLARKHEEEERKEIASWRRETRQPVDILVQHESLYRIDVEVTEREFFRKITKLFRSHPFNEVLDFVWKESQARKEIEDAWMSASLPFLDMCSMWQVESIEDLWRRAFGKGRRAHAARGRAAEAGAKAAVLDVRHYQPLQHRCDTIRRETEDEEEIAFRYLWLGEAAQRDLVARGVMRRNRRSGLLDSVAHPIAVRHYDEVDFAFGTEYRYLESREETERMAIIDGSLAEMDEICKQVISM